MQRTLGGFVLALAALGLAAGPARAQCAFQHPGKARVFKSRVTQIMVSCGNVGGNTPNVTTESGVPACAPPETFNESVGSPANGWVWGPQSYGTVTFKAARNALVSPLNPPNTADLAVSLTLKQIFDANGAVANAPGTLTTVVRVTFEDRVLGDMTVSDVRLDFPFTVQGNKAALKTSVNAVLNGMGKPGLPGCSSIEILSARVLDENGTPFATAGTFLPDL